jgi:hypothetical protein
VQKNMSAGVTTGVGCHYEFEKCNQFKRIYEGLGLKPESFSGIILSGGIGSFFCDPKFSYQRLLPAVTQLVCCDLDRYPP